MTLRRGGTGFALGTISSWNHPGSRQAMVSTQRTAKPLWCVQSRASRPASQVSTTYRLTHAVLERLPRADLPPRPHSLYNPYFPPLGCADEPLRAQHAHLVLAPPRPIRSAYPTAVPLSASPCCIALEHVHALRADATLDRHPPAYAPCPHTTPMRSALRPVLRSALLTLATLAVHPRALPLHSAFRPVRRLAHVLGAAAADVAGHGDGEGEGESV
ncbi:hypothetical protein BJY52DRAFT_134414 [Lactarius psammicola]|nr:hypothetical protein BJY52DRAFT_134414 [Lactarius psammicola]